MKKFNFRLQKVLDFKEHEFQKAQDLFRAEMAKLEVEKKALTEIQQDYKSALDQLIDFSKKPFNIKEMTVFYKYLFFKKSEMREQFDKTVQQNQVVNEKRENLVQAAKEKNILEKLKEKKQQTHHQMLDHFEQKMLDEFSITNYTRNQNEMA